MAYLDPNEAFQHFKDRSLEGIRAHFPIQGRTQTLFLEDLEVRDALAPDDLKAQKAAKVAGSTWSVPVFGHLVLKDNATGKVVDSKKVRLAELPKQTSRYSYIVDGGEYQVDSQWQLKHGAYTRRRQNGELETRFNVSGRPQFDITFDPAKKHFLMDYGNSKAIPVYPLLRALGVTDDELKKSWGEDILAANKTRRGVDTGLQAFYKADRGTAAPSREVAEKHFLDTMEASKMRPEVNELTLGKPFTSVTGDALQRATSKMIKVQAGAPEDNRDSLVFKDLRTTGDFAYDKLTAGALKRAILNKALRKVNSTNDIRELIKFDMFNVPLKQTFSKNAAARLATQLNPLEMVAGSQQTTIMGPGGIQSDNQVMDEAKFVNPSHLGFLDPIHTPEGGKTGVTLRLPIGVRRVGNEPKLPLYNVKTGKMELVGPAVFLTKNVALPDQVHWLNGSPKPNQKDVTISGHGNAIEKKPFSDVDYVMRHPSQLFSMTSNLIPFLGSTSGNRATYGAKQMEQAIALEHRQAPLVQVASGVSTPGQHTFEHVVGKQASHDSPVDGVVKSLSKDVAIVTDSAGKDHHVHLYNNYPLNDSKSFLDSSPLVAVGDRVKKGQTIADTNYSRGGALALGTNLHVAYLPYKGYNFEDGIVISKTAAKKLSSVHMHRPELQLQEKTILDKKKFQNHMPLVFRPNQLAKLGDDGVVKVGQTLHPGDPVILALNPFELRDRTGGAAIRKALSGQHNDSSVRWDSDHPGEVVSTHRSGDRVTVHVRTVEPAEVGDKLTGRHGNKGIISMVLEDHEMPHTKDGKPIEVALNPSGVPGRMNVGQVLEVAAGKIAEKTKKPYVVHNFEAKKDYLTSIQKELKEHGLSDTDELIDPKTKQSLGPVMSGPLHMLKLVHQVEKKSSVRSGMSLPGAPTHEGYDINLQPTGGGGVGGQSLSSLGVFSMLAHGATANLREMQTWKSEGSDPQSSPGKRWPSQHNEVWQALYTGGPLPTPKPTFAFKKFEDLLRGAGVNMEKKGHEFILSPLTDKQILELSHGRELPKPAELLTTKEGLDGNPRPKPGGLFDEKLTGGHGGTKWTHVSLAEPIPNPLFENAIQHITGLSRKDYTGLVHGEQSLSPSGDVVPVKSGYLTGGAAIQSLLAKIDVPSELKAAKHALNTTKSAQKVDSLLTRAKYLQALDQMSMKPAEAYMLHNLPIIPPVMRPITSTPSGTLRFADLNGLYADFAKLNDQMKDPTLRRHLTEQRRGDLRKDYYDGVKAIMGVGVPYPNAPQKGILHQIAGPNPKEGYFQDTLVNRKQDLSMRSTIVPEPALGLDEVGLPTQHGVTLFRPFIIKKLMETGVAKTPLQAQEFLAKNPEHPDTLRALDRVLAERPILLKRDPALHKYSIQGFHAKRVEGNAIKIHPLVTGGFNADFDGDTMSAFVPISRDAIEEAKRMMPTQNLFSEATGRLAYQPSLESLLGLYKLSLTGKDTGKNFQHGGAILEAVQKKNLNITDVVKLNGKKTTAGRVILASGVPEPLQENLLHNLDVRLDKKGMGTLLEKLGKDHQGSFDVAVNRLKDFGNGAAFGVLHVPVAGAPGIKSLAPERFIEVPMTGVGAHSLALKDFQTDKVTRDRHLDVAHQKADKIRASSLPKEQKDAQVIQAYMTAATKVKEEHERKVQEDPTNLYLMHRAGTKPDWNQYQQMTLAPFIMTDSANRRIPHAVTNSYSEGLDVAGYWTGMHGARRGTVLKVQEVQEPGAITKLMQNSTMHLLVNSHDCGTSHGIAMKVDEKDIHDRALAREVKLGNLHLPAGTLLTPSTVGQIRAIDKDAQLIVRSPLKCEDQKGICQKCLGLNANGHHFEIGANPGVMASQAIGERAVQLTLKAFHSGGVADQGGGTKLLNGFSRFEELVTLPKKIPNAATLAMVSGKIEKIQPDATGAKIWIGDHEHYVVKDPSGAFTHVPAPGGLVHPDWTPPRVGAVVKAGDRLSDPYRTNVNPHDLLVATKNIDKVQNQMAHDIYNLYKDEGVKRRHVEVMVKAISNLTKVKDIGDSEGILRGEFHPTSVIKAVNTNLLAQGKAPITHEPVIKGINELPFSIHKDWMGKLQYQNIRSILSESAALNARSNIHGTHPIPGVAYGAEFGLTSKDSLKPGLKHLQDVPGHHY